MMFEVEVKIKLKDRTDFIKKILELKANHVSNIIHTDIYYNSPDKDKDFAKTDEALRLRKNVEYKIPLEQSAKPNFKPNLQPNYKPNDLTFYIPENYNACGETSDLTYKGPKLDALTKSRIEHVCEIGDGCAMDNILQSIGFQQIITVKKERMLFEIMYKDTRIGIMVDRIQYLEGDYAEFEIVIENKQQMAAARKLIFEIMHQTGYAEGDSIRTSYLELIMQAKEKK